MKKFGVILAAVALALMVVGPVLAQGKAQEVCPVMGGKIDKKTYADYKGQRIYFCCPACIDAFKKDPENYLKKMQEQGVTPAKSPAAAGKGGN